MSGAAQSAHFSVHYAVEFMRKKKWKKNFKSREKKLLRFTIFFFVSVSTFPEQGEKHINEVYLNMIALLRLMMHGVLCS